MPDRMTEGMSDRALVERLRSKATWNDFDPATQDDFDEAADRIESLEQRVKVLGEACREVRHCGNAGAKLSRVASDKVKAALNPPA